MARCLRERRESPQGAPTHREEVYDAELIEEDVVLEWYRDPNGSKDVREAVKILVEWLEKAEGSDSDDDS